MSESSNSVQLRIERISNGFLFRSGGMPIYCETVDCLIVEVEKFVRIKAKVLTEKMRDFR